jgi:DNA polymerase-3 subunit gamma/tau
MSTRSLSFDEALQELAGLFTRLQVAQLAPQAIADDLPERQRLLDLAARFDPEYIQLGYQIAVHGRKELPLAPDEQAGFVMTLLRLFTFRPALDGDVTPARRPPVARVAPIVRTEATPPPVSPVVTPVQNVAKAASVPPWEELEAAPPVPEQEAFAEVQAEQPVVPSAPVPAQAAGPVSDDWHEILPALGISGMARELAQHCLLRGVEPTFVALSLSPTHRHLLLKPAQDKVQQALSEYFGRPLQVRIDLEDVGGDTPAAAAQRRRQARQEQAVASVEQDEFVREVIEQFDATLIESSIKPL